jgi:CRP-like cAMP-binding protein
LLLREGDPTDHVYVLTAGWVRVSTVLADGREVLYALRGPGDVLGELSAVLNGGRTASVRTIEPVKVVQLTGVTFLASLRDRPELAIAVIKELATRLREAEMARVDLATVDVSRRVATYLLRLVADHGVAGPSGIEIDMPLTQQDIANRVGSSLRAVARAIAVLRGRGVVVTARKRIVVARPDVLRSLVRSVPSGTDGL